MSITNYPDADFTPNIPNSGANTGKQSYNPTGSFRFWAQKVLPTVYDDSLSYYEILTKVVNYLNAVIQNVDSLNDSVDNTNSAFDTLQGYVNSTKDTIVSAYNELQDYVNTYFDSLDVQEEINAKLDSMASDGSLSELLAPFIPSLVSDWLSKNITPTSPAIDASLSVSGAGGDAKVTGDRFKNDEANLLHTTKLIYNPYTITANIETGHGYSTADGKKIDSANYYCSKELIPVSEQFIYVSDIGQNIVITCYDENKQYIDYTQAKVPNSHYIYQNTIKGTAYIGLTTSANTSVTKLSIHALTDNSIYEYPYTGKMVAENRAYNENGVAVSTTDFNAMLIPNLKGGERYYCNARYAYNFICFDELNSVITTPTPYIDVEKKGRIYTIPENAKCCWVNVQKNKTHGDISTVYYKLTNSKKILAIGDSITWLDGESGFDNATLFLGWQKQLEKTGYEVVSAGYSGYSYATGTNYGSIYTEIVTNNYDVTGYDYVILFGGTNDTLYNVSIGNRPTSYSDNAFDTATFDGALSAIIKYIRDNNPNCKIILCSMCKSEASVRDYNRAILYINEVEYLAKFWSCYYNNIFENMNISPETPNFALNFYDNTHPNKNGMIKIGQLMDKAISQA